MYDNELKLIFGVFKICRLINTIVVPITVKLIYVGLATRSNVF